MKDRGIPNSAPRGHWLVLTRYEIANLGFERVIRPAVPVVAEPYDPLARETLPEELSKLHAASEQEILKFARRNGLLTQEWRAEPIRLFRRAAHLARLCMTLVHDLDVIASNNEPPWAEHLVRGAIGSETYSVLAQPVDGHREVRAIWREFDDSSLRGYTREALVDMAGFDPSTFDLDRLNVPFGQPIAPPLIRSQAVSEISARDHPAQALQMPADADSPTAITRFVLADILNNPPWIEPPQVSLSDAVLPPSRSLEWGIAHSGGALQLRFRVEPLLSAVWFKLAQLASGTARLRVCARAQCGAFFVPHDQRQLYCNPPAARTSGKGGRRVESPCAYLERRDRKLRSTSDKGG
jgi:hypothetical protein